MANETDNILELLIDNQETSFSIRKISIIRKINYKSAYKAIEKLAQENIIDLEKLGNTSSISFNQTFNSRVFKVEYHRREQIKKNKDFKVLIARLEEISSPYIALLFGSRKKSSDIDLLIITENKKEIENTISLLPSDIHPTIITTKEFISMAKSKEFTVVSEAMKKNIILRGIEDYYCLLKNARRQTDQGGRT